MRETSTRTGTNNTECEEAELCAVGVPTTVVPVPVPVPTAVVPVPTAVVPVAPAAVGVLLGERVENDAQTVASDGVGAPQPRRPTSLGGSQDKSI